MKCIPKIFLFVKYASNLKSPRHIKVYIFTKMIFLNSLIDLLLSLYVEYKRSLKDETSIAKIDYWVGLARKYLQIRENNYDNKKYVYNYNLVTKRINKVIINDYLNISGLVTEK